MSIFWTGLVLIVFCITITGLIVAWKVNIPARENDVIAWAFKIILIGTAVGLLILGIVWGIIFLFKLQFDICTVSAIVGGIAFTIAFGYFGYLYSNAHSMVCH